MISTSGTRRSPALQSDLHRDRGLRINNDIPWTLEMIAIDLHIARE
jgi:hypothetical protein